MGTHRHPSFDVLLHALLKIPTADGLRCGRCPVVRGRVATLCIGERGEETPSGARMYVHSQERRERQPEKSQSCGTESDYLNRVGD